MIENSQHNSGFYKLVALWVVIETFIGGIIHSFNLPISGLFVASGACICLCLIGLNYNSNALIKATILVSVFKLMLSPQAPPTAYIAVGFQGLMAWLLFSFKKYYSAKCFVLAILALVESGMQKIIVLTLLYGVTFYKAINEFVAKLLHTNQPYNFSLIIAGCYLLLHLITAIWLGFFLKSLPAKISKWKQQFTLFTNNQIATAKQPISKTSKTKYRNLINAVIVFFACVLLFYLTNNITSQYKILQLIKRFVAVIIIWHFIVKPLAFFLMENWMKRYKQENNKSIDVVLNLLPDIMAVVKLSQKEAAKEKAAFNRVKLFTKLVIINIV